MKVVISWRRTSGWGPLKTPKTRRRPEEEPIDGRAAVCSCCCSWLLLIRWVSPVPLLAPHPRPCGHLCMRFGCYACIYVISNVYISAYVCIYVVLYILYILYILYVLYILYISSVYSVTSTCATHLSVYNHVGVDVPMYVICNTIDIYVLLYMSICLYVYMYICISIYMYIMYMYRSLGRQQATL